MEYYIINENNQQVGPLTIEQLQNFNIKPTTKVWKQGLPEWVNAEALQELNKLFITPPPPPPMPSNVPPPITNNQFNNERNYNEQQKYISSIPDNFDEQINLFEQANSIKELVSYLENIIKINYKLKKKEEKLYKPYDLFSKEETSIINSVYNNYVGRVLSGIIEKKAFLVPQKGILLCEEGIFIFFKDQIDYLNYSEIASFFNNNPKYQNFAIKVKSQPLGIIIGNINFTASPFTAFSSIKNSLTKDTIYDSLMYPFVINRDNKTALKAISLILDKTAIGSSKRVDSTTFRESFIMVNFLKSLLKIYQSFQR